MKRLLAGIACAALALTAPAFTQASGAVRSREPTSAAIFHGTLVDPAQWTFYASITSPDQADAASRRITCGAVVVGPSTVLTASHCVEKDSSQIAVAVGTGINPHVGGRVIGVRRVVLAPDADPPTFSHDVAVLQLASAVPASVKPISVAQPSDDATLLADGDRVQVAGVGQTDNVDPHSVAAVELRSAAMEVTAPGRCKVAIENGSRSTMNGDEFCTNGVPGTSRHDANIGDPCYGDSGGPIVAERSGRAPVLVGLVSTGTAQCATGSDIQPRLSAFAAFLEPYLPSASTQTATTSTGPSAGSGANRPDRSAAPGSATHAANAGRTAATARGRWVVALVAVGLVSFAGAAYLLRRRWRS